MLLVELVNSGGIHYESLVVRVLVSYDISPAIYTPGSDTCTA